MNRIDEELPLGALDPAAKDPGFWLRFHNRVMADAGGELARRRTAGDLSIADVVFAWRRTLVPMALLAAALAGILLLGHEPGAPIQTLALEDLLTEDLNLLDGSGILSSEPTGDLAILVVAEGGF